MHVSTASGTAGIVVTPGAEYTGTVDVRPWQDFTDDVACELVWYRDDGSLLTHSTGGWESEEANAWKSISCNAVAPADASYVALSLRFHSVYRGDVHFLDNAALVGSAHDGAPPLEDPAQHNLLDSEQNGFEAGFAGWVTQGNAKVARSTDVAANGQASMRVDKSAQDAVYTDSTRTVRVATTTGIDGIPVVAGRTYEGRVQTLSPTSRSPIRCELRWYDADAGILGTFGGPQTVGNPQVWTPHTCRAVAPAGAAYAALRVHIADADAGDPHFVDDAWFTDVTASADDDAAAPSPTVDMPGIDDDVALPTTTTVTEQDEGPDVVPDLTTTTLGIPTIPGSSTTAAVPTIASPRSLPSTTRATLVRPVDTTVGVTTTAPPTTAEPTTTNVPRTTTTRPPPTVAPSPPGNVPTASSTGPRVANPAHVGRVDVYGSETLTDVVADAIVVHGGGQLTATNVRVNGSVVVLPKVGAGTTKLHLTNSAVHAGLTVNVVDGAGNLYWGGEVPVDISVSGSWVHHPQGDGTYHTEALAGFGWPSGVRFTNSAFIQTGPFNGTATGAVNWHGADTVFDGVHFGWSNGVAAYYTVYVEGRNNVVRNSSFDKGRGDYIYPNSSPKASYNGNVDSSTGQSVTRP